MNTPFGGIVKYSPLDKKNDLNILKNLRDSLSLQLGRTSNTEPVAKQMAKTRRRMRRRRWRQRRHITPPFKLNTVEDLLYVAWNYQGNTFDWFTLWNLIPPLTELSSLVGMKELKSGVVDLILYYLQGLNNDDDMLHTVLYGSPGVGKTTVAKILAKIYCRMGFLPSEKVVVAKRSDLVGKWVGHSESKTMEILESALGGVLFIDEAYSMGHGDKTDSFAKASVDLINQFLSEHKGEFVCIVAGYEKEMNNCFFAINPGLQRRFAWKFYITSYSPNELCIMFHRKVSGGGWAIAEGAARDGFFTQHKDAFPFFGGDIDTFFTFCKTAHSRRIFGLEGVKKKLLSKDDIEEGMKVFGSHRKEEDDDKFLSYRMYS